MASGKSAPDTFLRLNDRPITKTDNDNIRQVIGQVTFDIDDGAGRARDYNTLNLRAHV